MNMTIWKKKSNIWNQKLNQFIENFSLFIKHKNSESKNPKVVKMEEYCSY